jgi:hypothetical protein
MLTKSAAAAALILALVRTPSPAEAQDLNETPTEVVAARQGVPLAPWTSGELCLPKSKGCVQAIYNPLTSEIAKFGDKLSTDFELGSSGEIRRRQTTLQKLQHR